MDFQRENTITQNGGWPKKERSIWTEFKGFITWHSVTEKYAELKFVEHHPHPSSSPHTKTTGISCNGNKTISSTIKVLESNDIGDVQPVLTKCQLHSKNGIIAQGVPGRYVSFANELPLDNNISYYGNITGWHRYETPTREDQPQQQQQQQQQHQHFVYPSSSGPYISSWINDAHQIPRHRPLVRSPTRYPPEPAPKPEPLPLPTSAAPISPLARLEWSTSGEPPRPSGSGGDSIPSTVKQPPPLTIITAAVDSVITPTIIGADQEAETSLLKAVKLEDINALADLLDREVTKDINATDKSGRTVLSYLVLKSNLPLLERLLKVPQIDVNKQDNEGNSPLHFAAQAGQVEALSLLLNCCSGVEVDVRNVFGFTALMKAGLQGRTKCAKVLLFAGASPTMRDIGRGLRAEQWARYCGRYICADVIEKYARNQLLSKTTSYGNWGGESELGIHFVNGRLQPPAVALQNALNHKNNSTSIKSKLKKAFQHSNPSNWNNNSRGGSFSLVTQLTSAALCVSSPVLPNSSKVSPVVKSLMKPFVIPRIEIVPDSDDSPEPSVKSLDSLDNTSKSSSESSSTKAARRLSYFVKLRKRSYF